MNGFSRYFCHKFFITAVASTVGSLSFQNCGSSKNNQTDITAASEAAHSAEDAPETIRAVWGYMPIVEAEL